MTKTLTLVLLLLLTTPLVTKAQSLEITSPDGGEVWEENDVHDLMWETTDDVEDVTIYLETTTPGNEPVTEAIATAPASVGRYSWVVPNLGNEPLQARIIVQGQESHDASDASFTILPEHSLSVRSNKRNSQFALRRYYPNPASDAVTFTWNPAGKNTVIATLFNSTGTVVRTTSINGNSNELRLEVSDLPQGAYFYELRTDGHIARGVLTIKR